ncbi:class II aldolase/adducin family protein [Sporomusa acidovorans]|uniref:3-oxo-tetronate 4-phosphate decarboxylase n=1 Tax=Sporomusa acidovorans (strain ATCC 49682 / DSM 3132 / Mol) TaxID=1123286 RepID=A0ABZ3J1D3_SPOA4|nr:class II aldolase/adducin family protein [Sporomusa acidovorans]OZC16541.1 methylthioribulose-1-phosphate dehydratase [Sporomusa acidovorans DSM 3132]SDF61103.1 L-fuculose-phosphate aldolase [Sporomusa acidovorans]
MREISQLIDVGKYLLTNQLAWGTSGNVSARTDKDTMIITASGTHMGNLSESDFAHCKISTGEVAGEKKASKETPMHIGIYRQRDDVNAILHSSPFNTTIFACSDTPIYSELFVESMYYLEHIAYVDYYHPGSMQLADAVTEQAPYANIIIMRHHGVVVYDKNVAEALVRLETLEIVCKMILQAKAAGVQLTKIPDKIVKSFLEDSGYRVRQKLPILK